jgi:hypothetical protein
MSGHGAEKDATQIRLMENLYGLRQVWCVTYDSPTPSMDGGAHPIRMADQDYEIAVRNYEFMQRQQRVSPKRNLRIETRWVSDYTDVTTTVTPPADPGADR